MKKQTTALLLAGAVGFAAWTMVLGAASCASHRPERPALYELELTECTAKSPTLAMSIACENGVRARYGRPPRALPLDGGGE